MARLLSRTCHSGSGTYMPILVAPTLETCLAHYQSSSFGSFALKLWHSELVLFSVVAECNMCTMNHPFYCLNGRKKKEVGWAVLTMPGESRNGRWAASHGVAGTGACCCKPPSSKVLGKSQGLQLFTLQTSLSAYLDLQVAKML